MIITAVITSITTSIITSIITAVVTAVVTTGWGLTLMEAMAMALPTVGR